MQEYFYAGVGERSFQIIKKKFLVLLLKIKFVKRNKEHSGSVVECWTKIERFLV